MSNQEQVKELSVRELFASDQYMIPLYQRNYAWGQTEIDQLIQDIWDYCRDDNKKGKPYYIGSLVVAKRDNGCYEVIDGQQRHTTLSILLAVLKNMKQCNGVSATNLTFESRELSTKTLQAMYKDKEKPNDGETSMLEAYKHCLNKLQGKGNKKEGAKGEEIIHVSDFCEYLMSNVRILRTEVPEDTDLNHYFEIMNNRGEQLEKHEVLKAQFMSELNDPNDSAVFAKVWDVCADMDCYVVMGFDANKASKGEPSEREHLFGKELDNLHFEKSLIKATGNTGEDSSFDKLLTGNFVEIDKKPKEKEENERFSSIIDFPNFLLHVLRLLRKGGEKPVALDDKQLLDEFNSYDKKNAMEFVQALLEYRFLFDRYVIKREHDESKDGKWCLKRRKTYDSSTSDSYVNTFEKTKDEKDDADLNQQLVMIQSMFHVSYPTRNYKYWLNGLLAYLHEHKDKVDGKELLNHLETLSDRIFFGRFASKDEESMEYDDILVFEKCLPQVHSNLEDKLTYSEGIHNFVFNRLDYLLWKQERDAKFVFTFRSSVEHWYPQNPLKGEKLKEKYLHHFGNLCLISHSKNSKVSNILPQSKTDHFKGSIESLKLKKMIEITKHDGWEADQIKEHGEAMIKTLCGECS